MTPLDDQVKKEPQVGTWRKERMYGERDTVLWAIVAGQTVEDFHVIGSALKEEDADTIILAHNARAALDVAMKVLTDAAHGCALGLAFYAGVKERQGIERRVYEREDAFIAIKSRMDVAHEALKEIRKLIGEDQG